MSNGLVYEIAVDFVLDHLFSTEYISINEEVWDRFEDETDEFIDGLTAEVAVTVNSIMTDLARYLRGREVVS